MPTNELPADDRGAIEALVAACIEALERGEKAPSTRLCAERPELRARVQRRLAQLAARGLIPATDDAVPDAIGPYRIVRELGSGGMGSVYLAEQAEPMRRLVALKIVKLGMDTREVVARFEKERQALARMSHPNIAQVFDAGITSAGRPYFAMEHVDGLGLTRFCDERALGPEERVRLLATVARAVHHAHERGFLHRDLKPSNVLVAEHAGVFVPKIIDFGIAKAITPTDGGADRDGPHTRADQMIGTPEYMSPEHAASGGLHVDARSDVYSLGAVLYELLCGEMPFDSARLRQVARGEMERILHDELPTLPSRRLARVADLTIRSRGRERTSLRRRIAGELDWITLKALEKDPRQRYATALELGEDLERWLRNDPVLAAPPARTYRLRKFVRRNRAAVVAGAATIVLAAASWFVLASATRDDRRLETARGDADRLVARAAAPQDDAARQTLGREALARYDALLRDHPDDIALRKGRCQALINLSEMHLNLGQLHDAERTGLDALADARGLLADRPDDVEFRRALAESARRAGRAIWRLQRADEAKPLFAEAVKHLDACFAKEPTRIHGIACSAAWRELSMTLVLPAERIARIDALQRSTDVLAQLFDGGIRDPSLHRQLVISRSELAIRLADAGRIDDAEVEAERAAKELAPIRGNRGQATAMVQKALATVADKLGDGEAVAERVTAAIQAAEQWRLEEPDHLPPGVALASLLAWLVEQQQQLHRFDAARVTIERQIELAEEMRRAFPSDPARQPVLAGTLYRSAHALWNRYRRLDLDQAHAWAQRACDEQATAVAADPSQAKTTVSFASLLLRIEDARGDDTRARWEALAQTLPTDRAPAGHFAGHYCDAWLAIARCRHRGGHTAEAVTALDHAERFLGAADGDERSACDAAHLRSLLALARGDAASAAAAAERLLVAASKSYERWRAAACLIGAANAAAGDPRAAAWRDHAAEVLRSVADQLANNVQRDPLDPWFAVPWGFAAAQLAAIEAAAGDRDAARERLDAAMPVLERVRDLAHRDVWPDDQWQQALALRDSLAAPR